MKHFDFFGHRYRLLLAALVLLTGILPAQSQYYYAQWTANLVAGDNTFTISSGTTNTNWTSGIQAVTPELLANSVTVNSSGSNVSTLVKKVSATQFVVNSSSAITGAIVTAQYPGVTVTCNAPVLTSAVRSSSTPTDVTFTWSNNGTAYYTIAFEYSTNGGTSWTTLCHGSTVSPRVCSIPNSSVLVRVRGYATGCGEVVSNSLTLDPSSTFTSYGCQAVGNAFSNPKSLGCGDICITFSTTNMTCYLTVPTTSVTTGTQIYILNTTTMLPVPATAANCSAYGASAGTSCNQINTGLRWIRFVSGSNSSVIYDVNPSTGVVTGSSLTCP